jgi:hypothetical protein
MESFLKKKSEKTQKEAQVSKTHNYFQMNGMLSIVEVFASWLTLTHC